MIKELVYLVMIQLILNIATVGQGKNTFVIPYEKYTLQNGLDVILHIDRSAPVVSVVVTYNVGSKCEIKGRSGYAHFVEHMMFQQSQHIQQDQFTKKIENAGGSANGNTTDALTKYDEIIPKNALEMTLWLESDRMGFLLSALTREAFDNQRNVILNEKKQRDNFNTAAKTEHIMNKIFYPETHPYNWEVIGEEKDLNNATLQDIIEFYKIYYGPQNATLVIAGDIDVAQTKEWVEKYFGEIKGGEKTLPAARKPVVIDETEKYYYEDKLVSIPELLIVQPAIERYNKDYYALAYLGELFGGSDKSPLYKIIVEELKLASSAQAYASCLELAGTFSINIKAYKGIELNNIETAIQKAFVLFEKERFTEKDLQRLKNRTKANFYRPLLSISSKASIIGYYNSLKGSPDYMDTDLNNYQNVTVEDIWRVYDKYVKNKNRFILSVVPMGKSNLAVSGSQQYIDINKDTLPNSAIKIDNVRINNEPVQSKYDRNIEPPQEPVPVITPPVVWKAKTKNNINIYGIEQKAVPVVQFSITIKGGMLFDPEDKIGVSYLLSSMMGKGTMKKTPVELREAMLDLGATISFKSDETSITVSCFCLSEKLDQSLSLVKEMLLEPRWNENEFSLLKKQTIESIKREDTNPSKIAHVVFNKLVYGSNNILAYSYMGTIKSVESIILDDLKNYYNKYISSSAAAITVIGDINKEKAVNKFNSLNCWQSKKIIFPQIKSGQNSVKPGIYFIDVPKATQSRLSVGHLSIAKSDKNYYKAVVMNTRLGEGLNSILSIALREGKGFTYGIRSGFGGNEYAGMFKITTNVQTNSTCESIKLIHNIVEEYRKGISQEELNGVKSAILNGDARKYEKPEQLFEMMNSIIMYNLPFDYIKKQQEIVKKTTIEEHTILSKKYILPEKMIYLIVGDKETQFEKLKELGLGNPILLDKEGNPVSR